MKKTYGFGQCQGKRGERVIKDLGGGNITHYVFDLSGTLIAEADGTGATQREYIDIDGLPVGFVEGTTLYFVHPDHLGAPQKITDATKAVVWHGQFTPFGQELSITGALTANWRFPGQYRDTEAALSYNYFRTYDPALGRYLQSDPIGLAGGLNTYAYVGGNPLMRVDPRGLKTYFEWLTGLPDSCRVYAINAIAGWQDALTFGLAAYLGGAIGLNSEVYESSTGYRHGEYAGIGTGFLIGGAYGLRAAGTKGVGREFSHWIPNRMGGPRSIWNGNYVSAARHFKHDPFRYPRGWRDLGPKWPAWLQQLDRIPNVYKGAVAGGAIVGGGVAIRN